MHLLQIIACIYYKLQSNFKEIFIKQKLDSRKSKGLSASLKLELEVHEPNNEELLDVTTNLAWGENAKRQGLKKHINRNSSKIF